MKIQYIIGILIAFLFASCSHEEEEQKPAYGKIDVAVSVTLPQPESVNTLTRAGGPYTDTDIKNADLLIFDKDAKFMERACTEVGTEFHAVGKILLKKWRATGKWNYYLKTLFSYYCWNAWIKLKQTRKTYEVEL